MIRRRTTEGKVPLLAIILATIVGWSSLGHAGPAVGPEQRQKAQRLYQQGNDFFRGGKIQEAYEAYRRSFELSPVYDVACNLGRAEARLGKEAEAAGHLAFCLENFSLSTRPEIRAAEKRFRGLLTELRVKLAVLELIAKPEGATVTIDGKTVGMAPIRQEVFLEPGEHHVVVHLEGYRPAARTLDVKQGMTHEVRLALDARASPSPPESAGDSNGQSRSDSQADAGGVSGAAGFEAESRGGVEAVGTSAARDEHSPIGGKPTWPYWVSGGVAAVGAGVGVTFLLRANKEANEIDDLQQQLEATASVDCNNSDAERCAELRSALSSKRDSEKTAVGGFVAAGAGAIFMLGYHLLFPEAPTQVAVSVAPSASAILLRTTF